MPMISRFNKVTLENRDDLTQSVQRSMMGVLVALYEGKLLTKVRMSDVLRLYGYEDEVDAQDEWIDFNSPKWHADYLAYKKRNPGIPVVDSFQDISDKPSELQ